MKEFNYIKYYYGCFYASHLTNQSLIIESWKYYKNLRVINWLKKEGYITVLKVTDKDNCKEIKFLFNTNKMIYDRYLKGIENNIGLELKPMGERIVKEEVDSFEQERLNLIEKPVERVDKEDHVRCTRTLEEIYSE